MGLTLRLTTWPRRMLPGHDAAGHGDQSARVRRWLRLRSCDWLETEGQPPKNLHVLAAPQSSYFTMKEREGNGEDQRRVKEQWRRRTTKMKAATERQQEEKNCKRD